MVHPKIPWKTQNTKTASEILVLACSGSFGGGPFWVIFSIFVWFGLDFNPLSLVPWIANLGLFCSGAGRHNSKVREGFVSSGDVSYRYIYIYIYICGGHIYIYICLLPGHLPTFFCGLEAKTCLSQLHLIKATTSAKAKKGYVGPQLKARLGLNCNPAPQVGKVMHTNLCRILTRSTRTHKGIWPLLAYKIPPIDYMALGPDIKPKP